MDERVGTEVEYPTRGPVDNKQSAAEWLQRRIRDVITETEHMWGVYVNSGILAKDREDYWIIDFTARLWPESMRIIEDEPTSKAIG